MWFGGVEGGWGAFDSSFWCAVAVQEAVQAAAQEGRAPVPSRCVASEGRVSAANPGSQSIWSSSRDMHNVNPGLIHPWLINRGVSPFRGDSDHSEGNTSLILGRVY